MTPLLSDLREPPVVGRFYMVPTIRYHWSGQLDDWPVLGVVHHDREHIGFERLHYHFDARFLSAHQYEDLRDGSLGLPPLGGLNANVLAEPEHKFWRKRNGPIPRQPTLKKLKCRRLIQRWLVAEQAAKWGLAEAYGNPAEPIRRPDGRLLCPHRKADLSQFEPDADGIVTCPLHGLRVKCASPSQPDTIRGGK